MEGDGVQRPSRVVAWHQEPLTCQDADQAEVAARGRAHSPVEGQCNRQDHLAEEGLALEQIHVEEVGLAWGGRLALGHAMGVVVVEDPGAAVPGRIVARGRGARPALSDRLALAFAQESKEAVDSSRRLS